MEIAGFLLALALFLIFWTVGIILAKPGQFWFPTATAFFSSVMVFYLNLKNAVIWLIFDPMALAIQGEPLTMFQSSGLIIAIAVFTIIAVAIINAISSFNRDGSLELWQ